MMAYDESQRALVYVKDYWRTISEGMEKEGDIYLSLEEKDVPYIAPFGRGNDFLMHETSSDEFRRVQTSSDVRHGSSLVPLFA
jgi:hypothetical protein